MAARHVDLTVNPAAAWRYLMCASMLGIPYKLLASGAGDVCIGGWASSCHPVCAPERRENLHSLMPVNS